MRLPRHASGLPRVWAMSFCACVVMAVPLAVRATGVFVAYWPFDETSGTSADDASPNANIGSYLESPRPSTDVPVTGFSNPRSLSFNGTGSYVAVPNLRLAGRSFTIAGWIKANDLARDRIWFSQGTSASSYDLLHLRLEAAGSLRFGFYDDDLITPAGVVRAGVWHHVAYTYDAPTKVRKVYVNGRLVASDTAGGHFAGNDVGYVGRWAPNDDEHWKGNIDDVRVIDAALPPGEVAALANVSYEEAASGGSQAASGNGGGRRGKGTNIQRAIIPSRFIPKPKAPAIKKASAPSKPVSKAKRKTGV